MVFFRSIRKALMASFTLLALVPMALLTIVVMAVYHQDTRDQVRIGNDVRDIKSFATAPASEKTDDASALIG